MAEANWLRHAIQIGLFEFRRSSRATRGDTARAFFLVGGMVVPTLMLAGFIYIFADSIRNAGAIALPPVARGTLAMLWLFGVFIAAQRVVSARPRIDAEPLVLTTVSARTAVGGLLIAETLRALAYLALPVFVLTGSAAVLFTAPASLLAVPLAAGLLALTAVLVGMIVGYAIAVLIATSPFVARHKTVLGGMTALGAMAGYLLVTLPQFGGIDQTSLAWLPAGWLADLAVIGTPIQGSLARAGAVILGSIFFVAAGGALVERAATRLWFIDPVRGDDGVPTEVRPVSAEGGPRDSLAAAISPIRIPGRGIVAQPTRRIAQWSILRTRRDPRRLNFLLFPVIMVGSGLFSYGLQAASPWTVLAPVCAVVLPWLAGATFAMNPFGDEGAVLPTTLLSVSGATYVRGLMLPGILIGLPVVALVTGATAIVAPYGLPVVGSLVGVGVLTTIVAVTTAPTVGMWLPRFSAISIGQSRAVVPPRLLTTALHFLGVAVPGTLLVLLVVTPEVARLVVAGVIGYLPAVLLAVLASDDGDVIASAAMWFEGMGTQIQQVGVGTFQLTAGGFLVLCGLSCAVISYRLGVRRFEQYTPPM